MPHLGVRDVAAFLRERTRRLGRPSLSLGLLILVLALLLGVVQLETQGVHGHGQVSAPQGCTKLNAKVPALEASGKPSSFYHTWKMRWEHTACRTSCWSMSWAHRVAQQVTLGASVVKRGLTQSASAVRVCWEAILAASLAVLLKCKELLAATWPIVLTCSLLTSLATSAAAVYFYRKPGADPSWDAPPLPDGFESFEEAEIFREMLVTLYETGETKYEALRQRFEELRQRNLQVSALYHQLVANNQQLLTGKDALQTELGLLRTAEDQLRYENGQLAEERDRIQSDFEHLRNQNLLLDGQLENAIEMLHVYSGQDRDSIAVSIRGGTAT